MLDAVDAVQEQAPRPYSKGPRVVVVRHLAKLTPPDSRALLLSRLVVLQAIRMRRRS